MFSHGHQGTRCKLSCPVFPQIPIPRHTWACVQAVYRIWTLITGTQARHSPSPPPQPRILPSVSVTGPGS